MKTTTAAHVAPTHIDRLHHPLTDEPSGTPSAYVSLALAALRSETATITRETRARLIANHNRPAVNRPFLGECDTYT